MSKEHIMTETEKLAKAALAVCDRWDTPDWSDHRHTADFIRDLREALTAWNTRPSVVPAELAELSARATHGEWVAENGGGRGSWIGNTSRAKDWAALSCGNSDQEAEANAAFIVAAVNYVRSLASQEG
jgi:hypothetical protein